MIPRYLPLRSSVVDLANIDCGAFLFNAHAYLESAWLLWAILFGFLNLSPGRCCCGGEACDACEDDTGPTSYTVVLNVFEDAGVDCLAYDGTYVTDDYHLSFNTEGDLCAWCIWSDIVVEGSRKAYVRVRNYRQIPAPNDYILEAWVGRYVDEGANCNQEAQAWRFQGEEPSATKWDCDGIVNQNVTFFGGSCWVFAAVKPTLQVTGNA